MRKQNRGKDFEEQIRLSLESLPNVSFDRLPDPMAGYSGIRNKYMRLFNVPLSKYVFP